MKIVFGSVKYIVFTAIVLAIVSLAYLYINRIKYEQSEIKMTLQTIASAEKSYYEHFKKYSTSTQDLGIDFSRLKNVEIFFDPNQFPKNTHVSKEELPLVTANSYRIIAFFRTSNNEVQLWELNNDKIRFIRTIK